MLFDVSGLPKAGVMPVSLSEDIDVPSEYALTSNGVTVSFNGQLANKGDVFLLDGNASAILKAECDKCLQPLRLSLNFSVDEKFRRDEKTDDDYWFFEGDIIDLAPAIETNLFVNIPIRFLCSEDCKGLCYVCGHNLNHGDCGCSNDRAESPFDILRSIFQ